MGRCTRAALEARRSAAGRRPRHRSNRVAGLALVLLLGALAGEPLAAQAPSSAHPDMNDRGAFEIFAAGKSIGTEKFEIRAGPGQVEAQGEITLRINQGGKTLEVKTSPNLVLDAQLNPLSYAWSQKGAQSSQLSVAFRSSAARTRYKTVGGEEETRDFHLSKDVVVLDDNVLHHYQLLAARYDQTKGGKQTFQAFIPQEALPGVITLEMAGTELVTVEGATLKLRHLVLTTELASINLWVDDLSHLQVVSVTEAQFLANRKQ